MTHLGYVGGLAPVSFPAIAKTDLPTEGVLVFAGLFGRQRHEVYDCAISEQEGPILPLLIYEETTS